jgi:hypothetical protein
MARRKRKARSAVASFVRDTKAEMGMYDMNLENTPLLYPVAYYAAFEKQPHLQTTYT